MYLQHFGLTEWPFGYTPDPRFVYLSPRHEEALAHLRYGVRDGGGFVQLTGEVGTGKTTICRYLLSQLPADLEVALVLNPMLSAEELLATVCDELVAGYPEGTRTRKTLVDALYRHLLESHAKGRRTVLIVDEAQNLSADALEQLRLLTNLETETRKLLQIILIGQPELTTLLGRRNLRQLAQRITARYHLMPFAAAETRAYVLHRLRVAGRVAPLFDPQALRAVHRGSRGVPRLINVICDRALLGAYAEGRSRVDARTVRRAAREALPSVSLVERRWRVAAAAALLLFAAGVTSAIVRGTPQRLKAFFTRAEQLPDAAVASVATAVTPVTAATPPAASPGVAGSEQELIGVLSPVDEATSRRRAFARIFALWGEPALASDGEPCEAAARAGIQCLEGHGSWSALRRLDLPVVLKLTLPEGGHRHVAVTRLDGDRVSLDLADGARVVHNTEIGPLWDGAYVFVWRPPTVGAGLLALGARGRAVVWLRQQLDDLQGTRDPSTSDVYDEALAARVADFQRRHALDPDGIVGVETLARLAASLDPRVPSLSGRR